MSAPRSRCDLGGHATGFFAPLSVTGTVRQMGGGVVKVAKHNQLEVDLGRAVIFEIGPVTMLLTELRAVAGNLPEVYRALGVEPEDYDMVVLKTASNFQYFLPIASRVIRVDTAGPGPVRDRVAALAAAAAPRLSARRRRLVARLSGVPMPSRLVRQGRFTQTDHNSGLPLGSRTNQEVSAR